MTNVKAKFNKLVRVLLLLASMPWLLTSCKMEDCYKDYKFIGTVLDQNGSPISDVEVFLVGAPEDQGALLAKTDELGSYSHLITKHKAALVGQGLRFYKDGLTQAISEPISAAEGGASTCGYREIRRDAQLSP